MSSCLPTPYRRIERSNPIAARGKPPGLLVFHAEGVFGVRTSFRYPPCPCVSSPKSRPGNKGLNSDVMFPAVFRGNPDLASARGTGTEGLL